MGERALLQSDLFHIEADRQELVLVGTGGKVLVLHVRGVLEFRAIGGLVPFRWRIIGSY